VTLLQALKKQAHVFQARRLQRVLQRSGGQPAKSHSGLLHYLLHLRTADATPAGVKCNEMRQFQLIYIYIAVSGVPSPDASMQQLRQNRSPKFGTRFQVDLT